ncbi:MAG: DUF1788 domain-containing protein [Bacteroidales bacterium]
MNNATTQYNAAAAFLGIYDKLSPEQLLTANLGGELPFYIQPYPIACEQEVEEQIALLMRRLKDAGRTVVEVNLYDLCLEVLREKRLLDMVFQNERRIPKPRLLRDLVATLKTELLIARIEERMNQSQAQLVFITGIAAVYPIIRSHTVLNNLQNIATKTPMILFYPGIYTNEHLTLFNRLKDDNYYRAHNLEYSTL